MFPISKSESEETVKGDETKEQTEAMNENAAAESTEPIGVATNDVAATVADDDKEIPAEEKSENDTN